MTGTGLESIQYGLQDQNYVFARLDDRYHFNTYSRKEIDEHLSLQREELCAEFLNILDQAAHIARNLHPNQAKIASEMAIYNQQSRSLRRREL